MVPTLVSFRGPPPCQFLLWSPSLSASLVILIPISLFHGPLVYLVVPNRSAPLVVPTPVSASYGSPPLLLPFVIINLLAPLIVPHPCQLSSGSLSAPLMIPLIMVPNPVSSLYGPASSSRNASTISVSLVIFYPRQYPPRPPFLSAVFVVFSPALSSHEPHQCQFLSWFPPMLAPLMAATLSVLSVIPNLSATLMPPPPPMSVPIVVPIPVSCIHGPLMLVLWSSLLLVPRIVPTPATLPHGPQPASPYPVSSTYDPHPCQLFLVDPPLLGQLFPIDVSFSHGFQSLSVYPIVPNPASSSCRSHPCQFRSWPPHCQLLSCPPHCQLLSGPTPPTLSAHIMPSILPAPTKCPQHCKLFSYPPTHYQLFSSAPTLSAPLMAPTLSAPVMSPDCQLLSRHHPCQILL